MAKRFMSARRNKPELVIPKRAPIIAKQERKVLHLYALGFTYQEISKKLGIKPKTISCYLQNIRGSIRAKTRADVIAYALKEGILAPKRQ